jgi:copper homeostasis protein
MSERVLFELCAETLEACVAARKGGADRIELCSALSKDGLTPSHGLIEAAISLSGLPVHVLIRPRGGDFVYSEDEFVVMCNDVAHARELGARGIVAGVLKADRTIDSDRMQRLVEVAGAMEVSFHRAFDLAPDLNAALELVVATGCKRLLTSGGSKDAVAGAESLRLLVEQAAGRIAIAAGGGVRVANAEDIVRKTGVKQLHGSLRKKTTVAAGTVLDPNANMYTVESADVQAMMAVLKDL